MVAVKRFDVFLVSLDPTLGVEIQKMRPCVVISPDEMNRYIGTVIVAPMTSKGNDYPSRVRLTFRARKGQVVLDQLPTVDKARLVQKLGTITDATARTISRQLIEMFTY